MSRAGSFADSWSARRMSVWVVWDPRIFISSPERSVIIPFPATFCPRYSTTQGVAKRLLGFAVPRFDRGTPPYDGSCVQGEYTQSLVAGKRMWIPYRSTSLSWYRIWCDEFVRIRRLRCPKRRLVPPIRIERTTNGLGNRCSIQLSYGGMGATILQESRKV